MLMVHGPHTPPSPHVPSGCASTLAVNIDLTHELTQALLQQTQPTDSQGRSTIAVLYANW